MLTSVGTLKGMFLDEAIVTFRSGKGGSGAVAFHREKHVPRGGPNGADGGRGGDVIIIADRAKRTLYDFKLLDHYEAESGIHGLGNKKGKNGRNIEIKVPVGTILTDVQTGELIVDMTVHGMKFVLCKGGKGGYGNARYVSSVRQAPNFAQKGEPGETVQAQLELKLLADVGLIGMPNAGKSTLISQISAAKPKIANYPFTTIVPNLGVVSFRDTTFVVADMPGLIEGASEGIGLGFQFLKHVERTRVLVHVVDVFPVEESDPIENFRIIENELETYSAEIHSRPRLIALNKIDLISQEELEALQAKFEEFGFPLFVISAATGQGVQPLMNAMLDQVEAAKPEEQLEVLMPALEKKTDDSWEIEEEEEGFFRISGRRVERMVAMTDFENDSAVRYLQRKLDRIGITEKLRELGAEEGDTIAIGEFEFSFTDEQ